LQNKVLAIIWDYDGTLVDSRKRNLNVTRKIIREILGKDAQNFPVLKTLENYYSAHTKAINWREFYKSSFGLNEQQIDEAGRMWTECQLEDNSSTPIIKGVEEIIIELSNLPQGIVSQNSKSQIIRSLKQRNILSYFKSIIGYEEVDLKSQKPDPEGLLLCLEILTDLKPGLVFYIGDHETDVLCVLNANNILKEKKTGIKIICIGALYSYSADTSAWRSRPDYEVRDTGNILSIIRGFNHQNK